MGEWKTAVARHFDAAAGTYAEAAACQRRIALDLAARVASERLPARPRVLELGCGTGFLTEALLPRMGGADWTATDLAPAMVAAARARLDPGAAFRVMDGEWPDPDLRELDLVVSSMAVQWFESLAPGLRRLHGRLRPGGLLAVTTLGPSTFREWGDACRAYGAEPGTPCYPDPEGLAAELGPGATLARRTWPLCFPSLPDFLAHLKAIGARAAAPDRAPFSPFLLRRILRTWGGRPFETSYDVLTLIWRKEG